MAANRPDFTTKNVVNEEAMKAAFQEGVTEGMANRDSMTVWVVTVYFEGTKLNERTFEVKDEMTTFAIDNVDTPGQSVRIDVKWVPVNYATDVDGKNSALKKAGDPDDEIVDAEVVEG